MEIICYIAAETVDDVNNWIKSFEAKTKSTYTCVRSRNCNGTKVLFKKYFKCHHNTKIQRIYDPSSSTRITKNTNCPSTLVVTLYKKRRYQGKNANFIKCMSEGMHCEIKLIPDHNHSTDNADALRFRPVSEETKDKLLMLFECGHSPATALQCLKTEIQLNNDNYENMLDDRHYCPNHNFCYYLFRKFHSDKYEPLKISKEHTISKIDEYNKIEDQSAMIDFEGEDYAIW